MKHTTSRINNFSILYRCFITLLAGHKRRWENRNAQPGRWQEQRGPFAKAFVNKATVTHISIIRGGVLLFLRRLFLLIFGFGEYVAILLSLMIGLYYGMLAGFGLALMRAWFMFVLSAIALAQGKLTDPIRICGAVACALLCFYPAQWYTPSFILSFITTAALISEGIFLSYIIIAPYTLYFFFQLPLQPLLANSLAIPWLAFITMGSMLLLNSLLAFLGSNLLAIPLDCALRRSEGFP